MCYLLVIMMIIFILLNNNNIITLKTTNWSCILEDVGKPISPKAFSFSLKKWVVTRVKA